MSSSAAAFGGSVQSKEVDSKRPISPDSDSNDSGVSSMNNGGGVASTIISVETLKAEQEKAEERQRQADFQQLKKLGKEEAFKKFQLLLDKSSIYSEFVIAQFQKEKEKEERKKVQEKNRRKNEPAAASADVEDSSAEKRDLTNSEPRRRSVRAKIASSKLKDQPMAKKKDVGRKRTSQKFSEFFDENEIYAKKGKYAKEAMPDLKIVQNSDTDRTAYDLTYFTGGTMRDYQLDGLVWLKTQFEVGVNCILADEMGLGKTVQVIALFAHFYAKGLPGPFLVVAPLSTLPNWTSEFARFAPKIPVILYHGLVKEERHCLINSIRQGADLDGKRVLPVVLTSYELVINDRHLLARFNWGYLVIDEGHRVKNTKSILKRELLRLRAGSKLLLTGTPLQNNLSELWSLLNFLLPEVFTDQEWFESFFDFSDVYAKDGETKIIAKEQEDQIITKLHQVLSPFLLRRVKADVELELPPKKEIWVYAPLTTTQVEMYKAAVEKCMLVYFGEDKKQRKSVEVIGKRRSILRPETLVDPEGEKNVSSSKNVELHMRTLNSTMMTFRKICLHPYLFEYPLTDEGEYLVNEDLVRSSGKMAVFDRLVSALVEKKHKILVFSQMTQVLNLLHDLLFMRGIEFCRLDGDMKLEDRQEQIAAFNNEKSTIPVFLISTKAGGLGLNLTAADTVIIFDSDWNPQGDLQAQDRCHRIGQTKPVVVYRLICRGTMDEQIVIRASAKRRLEKMIIHKGDFKFNRRSDTGRMSAEELMELLKSTDYNEILETGKAISDEDLRALLDRSVMTVDGVTSYSKSKDHACQAFKVVSEKVDDVVL